MHPGPNAPGMTSYKCNIGAISGLDGGYVIGEYRGFIELYWDNGKEAGNYLGFRV